MNCNKSFECRSSLDMPSVAHQSFVHSYPKRLIQKSQIKLNFVLAVYEEIAIRFLNLYPKGNYTKNGLAFVTGFGNEAV